MNRELGDKIRNEVKEAIEELLAENILPTYSVISAQMKNDFHPSDLQSGIHMGLDTGFFELGTQMELLVKEEIPHKTHIDKMVTAELKIREAMLAVEELGYDVSLTQAIICLNTVKDIVSDFVDKESK